MIDNLDLYNKLGIIYIDEIPRVTEILSSMLHEDSLMYWSNSLGFKRMSYKKTIEHAANIGAIVHETAENILRNKNPDEYNVFYEEYELNYAIKSFIDWYEIVKDKIEIISMEVPQFHNLFRGTYDLLAKINEKIYLVDFKTSSHIGYRYFLQLAAYRYLIKTNQNIDIDGCLILQLSKKERKFQEYVLDFESERDLKFINDCEEAFSRIVNAYHYRKYIEKQFGYIF